MTIPDPPNPRGMKIAGELASLLVSYQLYIWQFCSKYARYLVPTVLRSLMMKRMYKTTSHWKRLFFLYRPSHICSEPSQRGCGVARHHTVIQNSKNPPKIASLTVIFLEKFEQIYKTSVSGLCMPFIFKICQTATGKSVISQFHEFLNLIFGGFFAI